MDDDLAKAEKLLGTGYTAAYSDTAARRATIASAYALISIAKDIREFVKLIKKDMADEPEG